MSAIYLYPTHAAAAAQHGLFGDESFYSRPSTSYRAQRQAVHDPFDYAIRLAHQAQLRARAEAEAEAEAEARAAYAYEQRKRQHAIAVARARARAQAQAQAQAQAEAEERERARQQAIYHLYQQQQLRERERQRRIAAVKALEQERRRKAMEQYQRYQRRAQEAHFLDIIGHQIAQATRAFEDHFEREQPQQVESESAPEQSKRVAESKTPAPAVVNTEATTPATAEKSNVNDDETSETKQDSATEDFGVDLFQDTFQNLLAPFLEAFLGGPARSEPQADAATKQDRTKTAAVHQTPVAVADKTAPSSNEENTASASDKVKDPLRDIEPATTDAHVIEKPTSSTSSPEPSTTKATAPADHVTEKSKSQVPSSATSDAGSATSATSRGRSRSPRRARVSDVDEEGNEIAQPELEEDGGDNHDDGEDGTSDGGFVNLTAPSSSSSKTATS